MTVQLDIFSVHTHENNSDSKRHLEENRNHFSNQCKELIEIFQRGERLTNKEALVKYNIGHLPRRVKDLKDHNGINVLSEWIRDEENKTRFKVYYL